jgi:hypothetical protein
VIRSLAVAGALLTLAACQASHHDRKPAAADPATVRTSECHDWKTLSPAERRRLVTGMRDFFGGQVDQPGAHGQVLPDKAAFTLFDSYCRPPYADGFALYRIYGNAAAFTNPSTKGQS